MTDSSRTPATPPTAPASGNVPAQFLRLAKQINRAEANPDYPGAGVTITYGNNAIVGNFTLPIERLDDGDGERLQIVDFV